MYEYIVSACFCGINCKYSGGNNKNEFIRKLVIEGKAFPVCPEVFGGLSTPRKPCEITIDENGNKKILSKDGKDLTEEFKNGAQKTLQIAKILNIKKAILKSKSPSCGYKKVYDGTFSGKLKEGSGFAAQLLLDNGIKVYTEDDACQFK